MTHTTINKCSSISNLNNYYQYRRQALQQAPLAFLMILFDQILNFFICLKYMNPNFISVEILNIEAWSQLFHSNLASRQPVQTRETNTRHEDSTLNILVNMDTARMQNNSHGRHVIINKQVNEQHPINNLMKSSINVKSNCFPCMATHS